MEYDVKNADNTISNKQLCNETQRNNARICEECEKIETIATIVCDDCGLVYCENCDLHIHRKGKLRTHTRYPILQSTTSTISSTVVPIDALNTVTVKEWTKEMVLEWLRQIGLFEPYGMRFAEMGIDGKVLIEKLGEEPTLENDLGIVSRLHRKRLIREIQKIANDIIIKEKPLRNNEGSTDSSPTVMDSVAAMSLSEGVPTRQSTGRSRIKSPVAAANARHLTGRQGSLQGRVLRNQQEKLHGTPTSTKAKGSLSKVTTSPAKKMQEGLKIDIEDDASYTNATVTSKMFLWPVNVKDEESKDLSVSPNNETTPVRKPRALSGLGINMEQVNMGKTARSSYNFTEEGTLETQGFEINTKGIRATPFNKLGGDAASNIPINESLIILEELGHGAGGKVYKAIYAPTLKLVAVKIIRIFEQEKRHQLVRELRSLYGNFVSIYDDKSTNACDNLVGFYDAFTNRENGVVSIVLEYMDAGSLEDLVKAGIKCTEKTLANIAHGVLNGLAFLHGRHLLHRDIKLSNILVNKHGKVKISDFGISRDLENTLANASTFTGTLMYMAPERISGGTYSFPSDIWAFGLSLFACAIGKIPLPAENGYWGVVHAVQDEPPPNLANYGTFSPELRDFLEKALKKDPRMRLSAAELLHHPFITQYATQLDCQKRFNNERLESQNYEYLKALLVKIQAWYKRYNLSFENVLQTNHELLQESKEIDLEIRESLTSLSKEVGISIEITLLAYYNLIR